MGRGKHGLCLTTYTNKQCSASDTTCVFNQTYSSSDLKFCNRWIQRDFGFLGKALSLKSLSELNLVAFFGILVSILALRTFTHCSPTTNCNALKSTHAILLSRGTQSQSVIAQDICCVNALRLQAEARSLVFPQCTRRSLSSCNCLKCFLAVIHGVQQRLSAETLPGR